MTPPEVPAGPVRLTALSARAGCAAKLPQAVLADVLKRLGRPSAPGAGVLVDASRFDDAGVYQLRPDLALVQTVDFFTPIVDDPFDFGRVAAANALSDVYAMGGRPVTAMNLLGVPDDKIGPEVVARVLKGGAAMARAAGCALVGGHTIRTTEPIYGLSVTGVVHPKKLLVNTSARPGDLLVLTKPLGTGIATTALKRNLASPDLIRRVTRVMTTLNTPGPDLAEAGLVKAATDVTGFGVTGHLANVLRASGVAAEIDAAALPVLSRDIVPLIEHDCVPGGTHANLKTAAALFDFGRTPEPLRVLLADAQTSGPLLLCVPPKKWTAVRDVLKAHRTPAAAVIGRIVRGTPHARLA